MRRTIRWLLSTRDPRPRRLVQCPSPYTKQRQGARVVEAIATGFGHALRGLLIFLRILPGIVGPLVVVYGVWMLNHAAAVILAGLILWAADLQIPGIRRSR